MTLNKRVLINRYKLATPINITLPEGQIVQVEEVGMVHAGSRIILKDVLYTPTFAYNLISVPQLTQDAHLLSLMELTFVLYRTPP